MRKALALGTTALTLAGFAATAQPARAVDGTTTVALTVVDGVLAITTTPAAAGVNSQVVGTGRTFTAPLGLTTVTDTRATSTGWTLSASTTAFTLSTDPAVTIPANAATFSLLAAPTNTVGSNTYSNTATTTPSTGALTTATAAGINAATMTPVLHVAVPDAAAAGLYTGTVTQSVV